MLPAVCRREVAGHDRLVPCSSTSREWRNWQTRRLQVPVAARSWGFKSPLAHTSPRTDAPRRERGAIAHPRRLVLPLHAGEREPRSSRRSRDRPVVRGPCTRRRLARLPARNSRCCFTSWTAPSRHARAPSPMGGPICTFRSATSSTRTASSEELIVPASSARDCAAFALQPANDEQQQQGAHASAEARSGPHFHAHDNGAEQGSRARSIDLSSGVVAPVHAQAWFHARAPPHTWSSPVRALSGVSQDQICRPLRVGAP